MTSWQVSAHHNFFGFNLEYGLIFKLGKEVVADWMRYSTWQGFSYMPKMHLGCQMTVRHPRNKLLSRHRDNWKWLPDIGRASCSQIREIIGDSQQTSNEMVDHTWHQSHRWLINVSSITEIINRWRNNHKVDCRKSRSNESHFLMSKFQELRK